MRYLLPVIAVLVLAPAAQAQVPQPDDDPFYAVPGNTGELKDGAIIHSREIAPTAMSLPMPAKAWQVLYKTVDNTGAPTATVTTIMVPDAPWRGKGPQPVLSYQTAEDGAGTKCAPSYAIRAGIAATSNSAPETLLMMQALQRGWIVVAPDYQGPRSMFLGAEGEARGVLDSLRAARAFAPAGIDPGAPIGLWGYSGGAFASTVAAQLQRHHAPELKLSGVALGGVPADVKATIKKFSGSLFGGALIMGFVTVDRAYPEYKLTQYINDAGIKAMAQSQEDCINDAVIKHPLASIEQYAKDPKILDGPELKPMFEEMSPLTFPGVPAAPVYEYHARLDQLAPIGPARALINRFCRAGVRVQHVEDRLTEHIGLVALGATGAMDYLGDRFAGKPAPSTCTVPADPAPAGAAACAAPRARVASVRATRRRLVVRGTAGAICGRLARVTVSVARRIGGRCAYLASDGRLRPPRACSRPIALRARGGARWTLRRAVVLPPGRYEVRVRASDSAGRVETWRSRRAASFRVR